MKMLAALILMMTILAGSVRAETPPVTRHWQMQFWDYNNTDVTIDVYQKEDNTVTVTGRFSNGQVLAEYAPYVDVLLTHSDGEIAAVYFTDHLGPSFYGKTNVKTKAVTVTLPGPITRVIGRGDDRYRSTDINDYCNNELADNTFCDMSSRYPGGLPLTFGRSEFVQLPNLTPCSGFFGYTVKNYAAGNATYTVCDPMTGEKSTKTRMLEGMERYPPGGGRIP